MALPEQDLHLSLSLGFSSLPPPPPPPPPPPTPPVFSIHNSSWNHPSDRASREIRSILRGIDVNRAPATLDLEEEAGVSSPNSTISTISGKRSNRDAGCEDHEVERGSTRSVSDEEDGDASRKKLRLSKDQSAILEDSFKQHNTLNPKQKQALAKRLSLRPRQVEVWFQNRRARTKLKQTEVDCEYLKRCCESLTEENSRLVKEVQELRALKLGSQLYMAPPPTTLTMCPSCERVAVSPATVRRSDHRVMPVFPWPSSSSATDS